MNRLRDAASPYLQQHADNPVDWWQWGPEPFAEAKRRDVPVHLSVGYAACHWCHVMAHESFEDAETAALLNSGFVNIKVDREEHPEVDQIYMNALHALGEQGGWPLTMFLAPDAKPFWGGTYFPPRPAFGRPSFRQLLGAVGNAWRTNREAVATNGQALLSALEHGPQSTGAVSLDRAALDAIAGQMLGLMDPVNGGTRGAPKFPNAPLLDALWRAGLRTGEGAPLDAVERALRGLCQGGIYDHLGGGFSRYSVDGEWRVPHFEKMLYDNGQLLSLLSLAWRRSGDPLYKARMEETVGWLKREMRVGDGFASSLDADTEGEEGRTYAWSAGELRSLFDDSDYSLFADTYDVSDAGNWEGVNVLNRLQAPAGRLDEEAEHRLADIRARLLAVRDARPQPGRDDKVLADWNGAVIVGLVDAGQALQRRDWIDMAAAAHRFVMGTMTQDGRLGHAWRNGTLTWPGLATDHAWMMRGAVKLHAATGEGAFLDDALALFSILETHHFDVGTGAYFLTAEDAPGLIVRPRAFLDEAMPGANGVAAEALAHLHHLTGEAAHRDRAAAILAASGAHVAANIVGTASLQAALDSWLRGRLAIVAGGEGGGEIAARVAAEPDPALLAVAAASARLPTAHPAKAEMAGEALFLCDATRCLPPATSLATAEAALARTRSGLGSPA